MDKIDELGLGYIALALKNDSVVLTNIALHLANSHHPDYDRITDIAYRLKEAAESIELKCHK